MSIDYDRLRQLVAEMEQGTAATTRYIWLDLARELLRLRDGVETIRDRCAALAKNAQEAGIRTLASEMDINAKALTGLLNGDYE